MKSKCSILDAILLVACIICGTSATLAQGTDLGTIRGTVTDPRSAVLANATVQVTDSETGTSRDLATNEEGQYEAPGLKSGDYRVTVTARGFKTHIVNVSLSSGESVRADANLEVGEATATVEITAEAGIIQTEAPTISSTITNRQLVELPRDSRDIYSFLYLNPNITQGATEDSFKFIGAQSYGASFSLDGQRSNGGIFGGATTSQPSLEAIGELTVLSNNFTAEYAGIANVRVQTKRGTKDFHGSLFYNNRNSALAAWTIQDKNNLANFVPSFARPDYPKPYFNLNETGGSLTGPVPFLGRDKTFFTAAYERRWNVNPVLFALRVGATGAGVPGQRILNGDFSALTNANKPVVPDSVLPLLSAGELTSNTVLVGTTRRFVTIPQRLLNPTVAKLIQNFYPSSSLAAPVNLRGALSDFAQNLTARGTRDLVTARIDHDFTQNDKFYAVYNYQNQPRTSTQFAGVGYPAFGLLENEQENHTLALSYVHVFSSNL
ncbi:MAG: carboxypeptidase-like regulatory domain-containing protein, partial [Acidobacteriota bacterium]|nr:carboxypeptidase-like regulatory domain-containing protein [Acidobacteriota bacterium]